MVERSATEVAKSGKKAHTSLRTRPRSAAKLRIGRQKLKDTGMEQSPQIGDRITDKSASPDDSTVRDWIGPKAFGHWAELRKWIEAYYPDVFVPDWLYRGKKRGWSLRYKKSKAFCTFLPEYRLFSV